MAGGGLGVGGDEAATLGSLVGGARFASEWGGKGTSSRGSDIERP